MADIDDLDTGSRKSFPRYGGPWWVQDLLVAIEDEPEALLQESGARLHVLNFASGMDPGADIVSAFDPGPERPFQGFPDVLGAGYGKPSPGSGDMLVLPNFVGDFDPGFRRILPEFGDICPGSVACPCLQTETSAGSGPQQFSTSAEGDTPPLDDSGI